MQWCDLSQAPPGFKPGSSAWEVDDLPTKLPFPPYLSKFNMFLFLFLGYCRNWPWRLQKLEWGHDWTRVGYCEKCLHKVMNKWYNIKLAPGGMDVSIAPNQIQNSLTMKSGMHASLSSSPLKKSPNTTTFTQLHLVLKLAPCGGLGSGHGWISHQRMTVFILPDSHCTASY